MEQIKQLVEITFEKHNIQDEKLQLAITETLKSFEEYLSRNNKFALRVKENIDRDKAIKRKFN